MIVPLWVLWATGTIVAVPVLFLAVFDAWFLVTWIATGKLPCERIK